MDTFPRPYTFKEREIGWVAELQLTHHKPKAVPYSWIYSQLPKAIQAYVNVAELSKRKKRGGWLMKWLEAGYTIDHIGQALSQISVYQLDQESIIFQTLYRLAHPPAIQEVLTESYTPEEVRHYEPDLHAYDKLAQWGGLYESRDRLTDSGIL